ncbi:VOC family protein [Ruoffia halotolerans]|uniref:VOC family protein n=1 Tax=Ruoffia halotolerans TaxID=2748684 RepID=UPI001F39AA92|nr:VOC family protein [Ruoffia halotolerans]
MEPVKHLHHITAIAGPPQENLHFYRDVLGLKLIKQTVNFDDVNTYHFYFSNKGKDDGTILTFFPWDTRNRGVKGSGQVGRIAFSVPNGSLEHWKKHLETHDVIFEESNMFGNRGIIFEDNHTLRLAIVETDEENNNSDILGYYGVELLSSQPEATRDTLRDQLGLEELEATLEFFHLETVEEQRHHIIIPKEAPARGRDGVGTVHHVAWSMEDDHKQQEWCEYLQDEGFHVTEVKDRNYFKAMYMREKGHVLFEYATDGPGFADDEPLNALGQNFCFQNNMKASEKKLRKLYQNSKYRRIYAFF